ncbi:L-2-hydroxyglutarate oxidase [Mycobacterium sp. EPG1]|nr:L-2-hydroxyglutarate oxidase [Mycobacterium sp. EPG1]
MTHRVAVVGGGIIGAAVAREMLRRYPDTAVTVFEKEDRLAAHQTGRNSGVVHAGLYYQPGSAKALLCRRGVGLLGPAELRDLEPHVRGVAALHSPSTSVVDFAEVTRSLAADAMAAGASIRLGHEITGIAERATEVVLDVRTADGSGAETFDRVIACAGLQSDRVAAMAGDGPEPVIMPFRGEYYALKPHRRALVNGLVYPVPDPRYPFLGVHLTPRVDGEVLIGPNAVLALAREGYTWREVSPSDVAGVVRTPAFWRFARRHWRTGVREMAGSLSRRRFITAARAYVPELADDDVVAARAGVRAQALDADGGLVDDFRISIGERIAVLRNAPSPAATSAMAIAEHVVDRIQR